jgi:hypothetical protein
MQLTQKLGEMFWHQIYKYLHLATFSCSTIISNFLCKSSNTYTNTYAQATFLKVFYNTFYPIHKW